MPFRSNKARITAVLWLAFLLRMVGLNGRYLWYDEAFAILYAEKPFSTMLYGTVAQSPSGAAADVHPLLYYTLLHGWMQLAGQSLLAVRMLSVLLGVLMVAVVYQVATMLFEARVGLAAAVLTAVSPFAVYYAQETRMYALLGLASAWAVWAFVRGWQNGRWQAWTQFAVFGALTMYAHNLGALFIAAIGLWAAYQWWQKRDWHRFRQVIGAYFLMLVLFLPWLLILPSQLGKLRESYWVVRPGLLKLLQTVLVFHFMAENEATPVWLLGAGLFAVTLTIAWVLLIGWKNRVRLRSYGRAGSWSLIIGLTLIPILLNFAISQIQPVYIIRSLLPSAWAYYVLLAAIGVSPFVPNRIRYTTGGLLIGVMAAALMNHYAYHGFPRVPAAELAAMIRPNMNESGVVVHANKGTFFPMVYFDRALPQQFLADEPGSPDDTLAYPTQEALGLFAAPDLETAAADAPQVWYVIFRVDVDAYAAHNLLHPDVAWLQKKYHLINTQTVDDVVVYRFDSSGN
jgi:uncharacterized membrane protein